MGAVFAVRMYGHFRKLLRGESGPWTVHARKDGFEPLISDA